MVTLTNKGDEVSATHNVFEREVGIQNLDPSFLFDGPYAELPEDLRARLLAYLQTGEYPGKFLEGVIINDLRQTVNHGQGTEYERWYAYLPLLVKWAYNNCPGNYVGISNYARWVKHRV